MEPPRPAFLTLALALLLTANSSPLPSFSLSAPSSSASASSDPPTPLSPIPPPRPRSRRPRHSPPPFSPMSAKPNDAQDARGGVHSGQPPGPCGRGAGCRPRWPQHRWSGHPPREPRRHAAPGGRGLNLGKKFGLSFLGAIGVLQLVLGGFLFYTRRQIKKAGYERDVASPSTR